MRAIYQQVNCYEGQNFIRMEAVANTSKSYLQKKKWEWIPVSIIVLLLILAENVDERIDVLECHASWLISIFAMIPR